MYSSKTPFPLCSSNSLGVALLKSNQASVPVTSSTLVPFKPISFQTKQARKAADVKPRVANEWQSSVPPPGCDRENGKPYLLPFGVKKPKTENYYVVHLLIDYHHDLGRNECNLWSHPDHITVGRSKPPPAA